MHGGIGRPEISRYDWRWSGIHRQAPLVFGHSGRVPLVAETIGEGGRTKGSDNIAERKLSPHHG